ncbi:MAG: aldose epimerase family protein [Acidobacteriota bacterium]
MSREAAMPFTRILIALVLTAVTATACRPAPAPPPPAVEPAMSKPTLTRENFGTMPTGEAVDLYTFKNGHVEVRITNLGATITSIRTPDRNGQLGDIVLGFDDLQGYLGNTPFFGVVVGRYGNRIAKGQFSLDGHKYTLARNNGENHLHGGLAGFDKKVWTPRVLESDAGPSLQLSYLSKDGEEGYPGTLTATVIYTLTPKNELTIAYSATTDKKTVVNLTNHSYFNLSGTGDILSHEVTIDADRFTPVDKGLIPTGELQPVAGTPFDFTKPTAVGARIEQKDEQIQFGNGYDHNWVLNHAPGAMGLAARVTDPSSGRVLEVSTTEPGVQFYTGNFLDGTVTGKGGRVYQKRNALCLETQHFPDSPNHPAFPTTVLERGQTYATRTTFAFK